MKLAFTLRLRANHSVQRLTLGQTGTKETGNLLDQSLGSKEGIVLASKLLDELLVLVELLQVIGGHGIDTVVLGTVEIVLVTENAIIPAVSNNVVDVWYHLPLARHSLVVARRKISQHRSTRLDWGWTTEIVKRTRWTCQGGGRKAA